MASTAKKRQVLAALAAERDGQGRASRLLRRAPAALVLLLLVALPDVGSSFALPPEQRQAELDRRLKAEENRRAKWQAEREKRDRERAARGEQTSGGGGRGGVQGGSGMAGGGGGAGGLPGGGPRGG